MSNSLLVREHMGQGCKAPSLNFSIPSVVFFGKEGTNLYLTSVSLIINFKLFFEMTNSICFIAY